MAPYIFVSNRNGLVILAPLQVSFWGSPFNEGSVSNSSLSNMSFAFNGYPFNSWSSI